jgi:voltage-dependent anion channel protein 2
MTHFALLLLPLLLLYLYYADLLNDDFTSKFSLKCKKDAGRVTVTIETEQDSSGALKTKVGSKFSYAKFNVDKGQITATGGRVLETSLSVCPSVKMSFKAPDKGADLGFDYVKNNVYVTGVVDVMDMNKLSGSACVLAAPGFKIGADATYNLSGSVGLAGANVGASYTTGPVFASVIASSKSVVNAGLLYNVNSDLTLASQTTHSSDNLCTVLGVGAKYKLDKVGTIKAKFGSDGILSACLLRDIAPKVTLTASGSFATSDPFNTFKPGLGISM